MDTYASDHQTPLMPKPPPLRRNSAKLPQSQLDDAKDLDSDSDLSDSDLSYAMQSNRPQTGIERRRYASISSQGSASPSLRDRLLLDYSQVCLLIQVGNPVFLSKDQQVWLLGYKVYS